MKTLPSGYLPLELLLMSLAACGGATVATLLRRMKKTVSGLDVCAQGIRRDKHPTSFETIYLEFDLKSPDTGEEEIKKAILLSADSFCPVWAMIRNNVEVITRYRITTAGLTG